RTFLMLNYYLARQHESRALGRYGSLTLGSLRRLLLQQRGPVLDERQRRGTALGFGDGQNALAVEGDVVGYAASGSGQDRHSQWPHLSQTDARGFQRHFRCHQLAIRPHVEDLLAVVPPARKGSAGRRDLAFTARARKRDDVDFQLLRFV